MAELFKKKVSSYKVMRLEGYKPPLFSTHVKNYMPLQIVGKYNWRICDDAHSQRAAPFPA